MHNPFGSTIVAKSVDGKRTPFINTQIAGIMFIRVVTPVEDVNKAICFNKAVRSFKLENHIAFMKVVIDTSVIIAGLKKPGSASAMIIEMAIAGGIQPVGSFKTKQEAARIVQRSGLGREAWLKTDRLLYRTVEVAPSTRFGISTDISDNLFFEAAHEGGAQFIITNDHHLLEHDGYWGIRVLKPADFLDMANKAEGR